MSENTIVPTDWEKILPVETLAAGELHDILFLLRQELGASLEYYSQMPEEELRKSIKEGTDSPIKEWTHEIRNMVMRSNVLSGKPIMDFAGFAQLNTPEAELHPNNLSALYINAATTLYKTATSEINLDEQVQWFGKPLNKRLVLMLGVLHGERHAAIGSREALSRGLPFSQTDAKNWGLKR